MDWVASAATAAVGSSSSDRSSSYTLTEVETDARLVNGFDEIWTALIAGDGDTGECSLCCRRRGLSDSEGRVAVMRLGERSSSHGESESIGVEIFCSGFGHWSRTRASCTSTMISASSVSEVKLSPFRSSHALPWQCIFTPFQPIHSTCTLWGARGLASRYAARTWTREINLFVDNW